MIQNAVSVCCREPSEHNRKWDAPDAKALRPKPVASSVETGHLMRKADAAREEMSLQTETHILNACQFAHSTQIAGEMFDSYLSAMACKMTSCFYLAGLNWCSGEQCTDQQILDFLVEAQKESSQRPAFQSAGRTSMDQDAKVFLREPHTLWVPFISIRAHSKKKTFKSSTMK